LAARPCGYRVARWQCGHRDRERSPQSGPPFFMGGSSGEALTYLDLFGGR
jgi:hypothetical protein